MGCAIAIATLGITFVIIAFILSVVALFVPFWMYSSNIITVILGVKSKGLFLSCLDAYELHKGNADCSWNDFDSQENWFKACMILWIIGTIFLTLCAFAAFFICCQTCKTPKFASFLTFGSLFAALCLCIAVIVYGVKHGDYWERSGLNYYDWGYYVAIAAAGFSLLSFLLFGCSIHCLRSGNV